MKINFEFGFKESNLIRGSFHIGAVIKALWENAFLEGITLQNESKNSEFVKIFNCGFASLEKKLEKLKP